MHILGYKRMMPIFNHFHSKTGIIKQWLRAKNGFYIFKAWLKKKKENQEDYVSETVWDPESLKYLLPGPLPKKFTNRYSKVKSDL